MLSLLIQWILSALVLVAVAYMIPDIVIENFGVALFAALVLGFVNTIIRPVLSFLTLPINILTLGLFSFVINALTLGLTAYLVPGFTIDGFVPALLGALLLALLNYVVEMIKKDNSTEALR